MIIAQVSCDSCPLIVSRASLVCYNVATIIIQATATAITLYDPCLLIT